MFYVDDIRIIHTATLATYLTTSNIWCSYECIYMYTTTTTTTRPIRNTHRYNTYAKIRIMNNREHEQQLTTTLISQLRTTTKIQDDQRSKSVYNGQLRA